MIPSLAEQFRSLVWDRPRYGRVTALIVTIALVYTVNEVLKTLPR